MAGKVSRDKMRGANKVKQIRLGCQCHCPVIFMVTFADMIKGGGRRGSEVEWGRGQRQRGEQGRIEGERSCSEKENDGQDSIDTNFGDIDNAEQVSDIMKNYSLSDIFFML